MRKTKLRFWSVDKLTNKNIRVEAGSWRWNSNYRKVCQGTSYEV